jgi:hypothetical protein
LQLYLECKRKRHGLLGFLLIRSWGQSPFFALKISVNPCISGRKKVTVPNSQTIPTTAKGNIAIQSVTGTGMHP